MIPIQLGEKTYGLTFRHQHIPFDPMSDTKRLANTLTLAQVFELAEDKKGTANPFPIAEGKALCSVKDVFKKEVGRKVALTRLLKDWGVGKDARAKVWKAYHGRGGRVTVLIGIPV